MTVPTEGQLVTEGAIGGFIGADGKGIEWKKQDDGSYISECKVPLAFIDGKPNGEVKYTYSLVPDGKGYLRISVAKAKLLTKEQAVQAEAEKAVVGDHTVPVPEKDLKKGGKAKEK